MTGADTRRLTSAPLELVADGRARTRLRLALVAVLAALTAAASLHLHADGPASSASRERLQLANSALREEAARLGAELEFERATRAALDKQVAEMNQRVADLERQLAFVQAQNGRPRRPASPN